jgi:hypothetical protein
VPLPFDPVHAPSMTLELALTLEDFLGYIATWSAVTAYIAAHGRDPVPELANAVSDVWGSPGTTRIVRWPMTIRAGRV